MNLITSRTGKQGIHLQIADALRAKIRSGELQPGQQLPAASALARDCGTYELAVHKAMTILAEEGLVERRPRAGTIVREIKNTLTAAAVYLPNRTLSSDWSGNYVQAVYQSLAQRCEGEGISLKPFFDSRRQEEFDALPGELTQAIRQRKIQAAFSLYSDFRADSLRELGLPLAKLGRYGPDRVNFDPRAIARAMVGAAAAAGKRSLGIITTMNAESVDFFSALEEYTAEKKITLRQECIRSPLEYVCSSNAAAYGYQQFLTLMSMRDCPECVLVYPDLIVPGVVSARLSLGHRVARDLLCVFHANRGHAAFCPFPASWLMSDPALIADGLLQQVRTQLEGKAPMPIEIDVTIENSTGMPEFLLSGTPD